MRSVSDKVVQKIKTHILRSITFSRKLCPLSDNVEKYVGARHATDGNITRFMRFACWITKATDTHSEYVMLITFPLQQWLHERTLLLRYAYIASLNMKSVQHVLNWMMSVTYCFYH
jgi:hypothetical protein